MRHIYYSLSIKSIDKWLFAEINRILQINLYFEIRFVCKIFGLVSNQHQQQIWWSLCVNPIKPNTNYMLWITVCIGTVNLTINRWWYLSRKVVKNIRAFNFSIFQAWFIDNKLNLKSTSKCFILKLPTKLIFAEWSEFVSIA